MRAIHTHVPRLDRSSAITGTCAALGECAVDACGKARVEVKGALVESLKNGQSGRKSEQNQNALCMNIKNLALSS